MEYSLRYIKCLMIASMALFFSIVTLDNIIDYGSNWLCIQHVMSMDTTYRHSELMWRAMTNPVIQHYTFCFIIFWEMMTAILCWTGCYKLLSKATASDSDFNQAKRISYLGLCCGYLLYMVGFMIVGGEWFSMWQSPTWNEQMIAGLFVGLIMFVMIFLASRDS